MVNRHDIFTDMLIEAQRRNPGKVILPLHGRSYMESFAPFEDGTHWLYYHVDPEEKSAHSVAMDAYSGEFIKEE